MGKKSNELRKVYSPDITPYSFEGDSYFVGTTLSILVAPIRLITRVMHNIFVLPADMQKGYANSLLIVSAALLGIGVFDYLYAGKFILVLSQIPVLIYAVQLRKKAVKSERLAHAKREIEIDEDQINEACSNIYNELDTILGSDENESKS